MAETRAAVSPDSVVRTPSHSSPPAWAVFLASSWTWCIGMYLPVLLVRDYGIWGWVVFAAPNVIGAAAMGWTVRDALASERLVAAHRSAMIAFAVVTVAFQLFFGAWFFQDSFEFEWAASAAAVGVVPLVTAVFVLILIVDDCPRTRLGLAAITYVISLGCLGIFVWMQGTAIPIGAESSHPGLWALAIACAFGFALCPYLDLTFHDARQRTSVTGGRVAFGAGFGLLFFLMIVFSLFYSRGFGDVAVTALVVHLVIQLAFTSAVHLNAIRGLAGRGTLMICGAGLLLVLPLGYFGSELVYRLFLSFYGLVFPAYVWVCMVPNWREARRPSARAIAVWVVVMAAAAPFYYLAFVAEQMQWAALGVAIVLLGRLLLAAGSAYRRMA